MLTNHGSFGPMAQKGVTYIGEGAVLYAELRLNVLLQGCACVHHLDKSYKLVLIP